MDFLTNLHIMDYSLLLGVHNCEAEDQETDPRSGDELDDEEYDSGGSGVALTPPDSPLANRSVPILPALPLPPATCIPHHSWKGIPQLSHSGASYVPLRSQFEDSGSFYCL